MHHKCDYFFRRLLHPLPEGLGALRAGGLERVHDVASGQRDGDPAELRPVRGGVHAGAEALLAQVHRRRLEDGRGRGVLHARELHEGHSIAIKYFTYD